MEKSVYIYLQVACASSSFRFAKITGMMVVRLVIQVSLPHWVKPWFSTELPFLCSAPTRSRTRGQTAPFGQISERMLPARAWGMAAGFQVRVGPGVPVSGPGPLWSWMTSTRMTVQGSTRCPGVPEIKSAPNLRPGNPTDEDGRFIVEAMSTLVSTIYRILPEMSVTVCPNQRVMIIDSLLLR